MKELKSLELLNLEYTVPPRAYLEGAESYIREEMDFGIIRDREDLDAYAQERMTKYSTGQITDAGLVHLEQLHSLRSLNLRGNEVTDEGLKRIAGMPSLEELTIPKFSTTEEGMAALQKENPELKIYRY